MDRGAADPVIRDRPRVVAAFALAMAVHGDQTRKSTTIPYIAHLMAVAALALEAGGDEDMAIAALLHDSVEDSDDGAATETRIRDEFGDRVADMVMACSDAVATPGAEKPAWRARKEQYLAQLAAEPDHAVLIISACDKLHNARSVVADLRVQGPSVWDRFNSSRGDQLWYYQSVADIYRSRIPGWLSDEVGRTVAEMHTLAVDGAPYSK